MPPKKQLEKVVQEYEFLLSPVDDPNQLPISMKGIGKHSLGRGNLMVKDSRISREHCGFEIKVDENTKSQSVYIYRKGLNPLFVTRKDKVNSIDDPFLLEEGDELSLLPAFVDKPHKFTFSTESSKKRKSETNDDKKNIDKKNTDKKNIEINLVDEEDEEKANKKRKIEINLIDEDKKIAKPKYGKSKSNEAIVNSKKISDPSESEKADRELALKYQPKECSLCLEELDFEFFQSLMCGHEFCRECLNGYLTMKISEKAIPIPCPFNGCTTNVSESDLRLLIEPKLMEKYEKFMLSNFIETNANDFSCCPTPNCPYLFYYEPGDFDFKCPKCQKRYCLNCKVDYHVKSTCKMYQQWCVQNGQADDLFTNFVRGNKLKQCFKCKKFVQKVSGCNHITCTCGAQFCYVCGTKYPCKKKCVSYNGDEEEGSTDDDGYGDSDSESNY
jgi:hypothetical protein